MTLLTRIHFCGKHFWLPGGGFSVASLSWLMLIVIHSIAIQRYSTAHPSAATFTGETEASLFLWLHYFKTSVSFHPWSKGRSLIKALERLPVI